MFKSIAPSVYVLTGMILFAVIIGSGHVIASVPYFPKALEAEPFYCPPDEVREYPEVQPVLGSFEAQWYAEELRNLREEPLFQQGQAADRVVRFTWIRSFHAAVVVRTIETPTGDVRLVAKQAAGRDGCPSLGGNDCGIDRWLTSSEKARLAELHAKVLSGPVINCSFGVDGARWIVESSGQGDYRFAQAFTPKTGPVREFGDALLDMTGWGFSEVY